MLLHSDGFDSHGAGAVTLEDGDPGWTSSANVFIEAGEGKFGSNALKAYNGDAAQAAFPFSATGAMGAYFRVVDAVDVVLLYDVTHSVALVTRLANGTVVVRDGGGNVRITSAAGAMALDTYAWVEVNYRPDGVWLAIDALPIAPYTGAYTAPGTAARLFSGSPAADRLVDDLVVWDDQGSFFNTYALGPRRIQLLRPTSDGDVVEWEPAPGNDNWEAVDSADWTGGAGVTSVVGGQKDLYRFEPLAVNPGTINAVVVKTQVQNTGETAAAIQHVVRGTDTLEAGAPAQVVPTVAPGVLRSTFYRDQNNLSWTASAVNSVQAGQVSTNL